MRKHSFIHFTACIFSLIVIFFITTAQPLYKNFRRQNTDGSGRRVKLACVNEAAHLGLAVAEGLGKQPVAEISKSIIEMGYNCVRLTWPLYLAINETFGTMINVRQSSKSFGLYETIAGLLAHNPSIIDLSLMDAFQVVVAGLAKNNVIIILDNNGIKTVVIGDQFRRRNQLSSTTEPGYANAGPHKVIFHPTTGLCVQEKKLMQPLQLGSCSEAEKWSYTPQKTLTVTGTYFCLQADQLGKPANLGIICTDSNSKWEVMLSGSKMQLSSTLENGGIVCLDVDSSNVIVTNTCKCQSVSECDPGTQWFEIKDSSRDTNVASKSLYVQISALLYDFGKEMFGGLAFSRENKNYHGLAL